MLRRRQRAYPPQTLGGLSAISLAHRVWRAQALSPGQLILRPCRGVGALLVRVLLLEASAVRRGLRLLLLRLGQRQRVLVAPLGLRLLRRPAFLQTLWPERKAMLQALQALREAFRAMQRLSRQADLVLLPVGTQG